MLMIGTHWTILQSTTTTPTYLIWHWWWGKKCWFFDFFRENWEKLKNFSYPAHRLILCRSSEVFDRMLSQKWNGDSKRVSFLLPQNKHWPWPSQQEIELTEESQCQAVFSQFLRFLYCNHVLLNSENALPILVLADKYNVIGLKKVGENGKKWIYRIGI